MFYSVFYRPFLAHPRVSVIIIFEVIFSHFQSFSVFIGPVLFLRSISVIFSPFQSFSVLFSPFRSFAVLFRPFQTFSVLFSPFQSFSVLFSSFQFFSVLICLSFRPFQSFSVLSVLSLLSVLSVLSVLFVRFSLQLYSPKTFWHQGDVRIVVYFGI
jgi:hypothetical protein